MSRRTQAATNPVFGAIRWDAWYSNVPPGTTYQPNLYPLAYQYRAPWFCTPHTVSPLIDCAGQRQLVVDLEIRWAAAAGINFWAFDQYQGGNIGLMNAWQFYQNSAFNSQINWCMLAVNDFLFGSTGNFTTQVNQYVAWFQQSNYQKVLTNRPLLFLFFSPYNFPSFGNSAANFATMISALRTATTGAGLGSPYIVVMNDSGHTTMTAIGADAISAYVGPSPGPAGAPYSALVSNVEANWTTMANTGAPIVPNAQFGWDTRPRGGTDWVVPGTVAQRAAHLQDLINYIKNNASSCPANAGIVYSWTECDEGGGAMIPTVGDLPGEVPVLNNILSAVANLAR